MLTKSALEISKLCPPGRNEKGEYFNIWWASLHMCYRTRYNTWNLKEYLSDSGDSVWSNPENQNELITINISGGIYLTYFDNIKVGDSVKWEDVPDGSIVFDDFFEEYGTTNSWYVFRKFKGMCRCVGTFQNDWNDRNVNDDYTTWCNKSVHSPKVKIIALNLTGNESGQELKDLTEKFLESQK